MKLAALHGFLGQNSDWTQLFQNHVLNNHLSAVDLFSEDIVDMWTWAEKFNSKFNVAHQNILLGYSLGGRLALHALLNNPEMWSGAVIVSAHLGLNTIEEKMKRKENDKNWAQRFQSDPWDQLMHDWNNQSVFKEEHFNFIRRENDFCRNQLSQAMCEWSLARQDQLKERVSSLQIPILWITGAKDNFYSKQAAGLHLKHPKSQIWVAPEAGHRVPWQCPENYLSKMVQFLKSIKEEN